MNPTELFALLPDMATFARVVDSGNFSEAARQLGSTPSTVSRQIKRLEEALGTRLLERSTRSIRVTDSGAQVYGYCRDIVGAASGAVDVAGQVVGEPRGKVSVSAPIAFARSVIHPLIPEFLRSWPDVDVQLVFADREVDPLRDDVDIVIRLTRSPPLGLAARRLGTAKWLLCASRAYLDAHGTPVEPRDLARHECLYLGETVDDNRWHFRRGTQTQSLEVRGRYTANDVSARLDAALLGFGIASLPDFAAAQTLAQGDLVQVLADWEFEARSYMGPVWLLYPPNRFLPSRVRALIDYLASRLRDGTDE
ncbi:LysR substrate-binding domain-containing protein [Paraburkholderia sabiae]|uniref:LysR family transcriptional regulator n=1 Tax=Paraburkholderia sabiae TaxID=273251 RepID=A0ABU9QGV5_9BURK|nr:LysR family transcriptional regulator [Paraburkholderia sabiae]WJZ75891.1 LysR family transcriptional regulator [Paraburkholderia sabiae]CAD6554572.1 HTH-type transcriptional regulator DmlR [Paraburkholderia sabiae]